MVLADKKAKIAVIFLSFLKLKRFIYFGRRERACTQGVTEREREILADYLLSS